MKKIVGPAVLSRAPPFNKLVITWIRGGKVGYSTDFSGEFALNKTLSYEHDAYIKKFSSTRRMKRDAVIAATLNDPLRDAIKQFDVGIDGGYYIGLDEYSMGDDDGSVLDRNGPPEGQPGLWCQWVPNEDGTAIEWDGGEKFYNYVEWIVYIVEHFLKPWGYSISGQVTWRGEDIDDRGTIYAKNNEIEAVDDVIVNPGPRTF